MPRFPPTLNAIKSALRTRYRRARKTKRREREGRQERERERSPTGTSRKLEEWRKNKRDAACDEGRVTDGRTEDKCRRLRQR